MLCVGLWTCAEFADSVSDWCFDFVKNVLPLFFFLLSIVYVGTDMLIHSHTHCLLLFVHVLCSGRLMQGKSQSSFSVSYKNMKKSPSLQSLDDLSIDSYSLEDCDSYSLLERGTCTPEHHILLLGFLFIQALY